MSKLKSLVKELMNEIESEVDEVTTTGNIAGYNTPFAFKKTNGNDEDEEADDDYIDYITRSTDYKRVSENRWRELKKADGNAKQKIGVGIRGINKQLTEIETFLKWYGRIKKENGLKSEDQWRRTQKHLTKIRERLNRIATSISEL